MKKLMAGLSCTLLLFLALIPASAWAVQVTCFGPEQYVRTGGRPDVYSDSFSARGTKGRILVTNGDVDGASRIDSARIFLNGRMVFGPRDFNHRTQSLSADVNLAADNTLKVVLSGRFVQFRHDQHEKKSRRRYGFLFFGWLRHIDFWPFHHHPKEHEKPYLMITITRDVPLPTAALSIAPPTIVAGQSASLTWTCTQADTCLIDPGIGQVQDSGTLQVSPSATTTYTLTAASIAGSATASATVTVYDPPTAQISAVPQSIVAGKSATLTWSTAHADSISIAPGIGAVAASGSMSVSPSATTTYTITATGPGGGAAAETKVTVTQPGVTVNLGPAVASITQGQAVALTWTSTNADKAYIDNGVGPVSPSGTVTLTPEHTTTYTLSVTGTDGTASAQAVVHVDGTPAPQHQGTWGFQYNKLIPADATVGQYDQKRFALVVGQVQDIDGKPIQGVQVSMLSHPEYGTAATDADGKFALPVEGGAVMTVVYQKQGLITSHRQVNVPWNDTAIADTVTLVAQDPAATTVTFDGNPNTVIVHRSTPFTDQFGTRAATLVFTGDNQAFLTDKNGNEIQALPKITTRATIFPTPASMPAVLPPTSAFTYCVELSVDGAPRVKFSKPVTVWVPNYLGFKVGGIVPVGYYDRDKGVWVPQDNGRVVQLLDTNGDGIVDALDANGDGQPDDLNGDGSYADEVKGLTDPSVYAPGATFWRSTVTHFCIWDDNWPYGFPQDAISPNPPTDPDADAQKIEPQDCKRHYNSFVEERSRIFHEDIPIPGTGMTLHYASNRVKGYKTVITVPVSGDAVPASLKRIIVRVRIAGRAFEQTLPALADQEAKFIWDGMDFQGNEIPGVIIAHISIGFVYDAVYYSSLNSWYRSFARVGDDVTGIPAEQEVISWKNSQIEVARGNVGTGDIAEGWTISSHNQLYIDAANILLSKGDGSTIKPVSSAIITTVAGQLEIGHGGDGGPAVQAHLHTPFGVAIDASGNIYIADSYNSRIRKVDTNGIITTVAGNGSFGYSGDGGPAVQAKLNGPSGVATDASGNLYIADSGNHCIRKVDPSGIITTVAGNGSYGYSGDGGPAVQAQLYNPEGLAIDASGNLYVADTYNQRIRKVDPSGIITTVAGNGSYGYSGDGGPAVQAQLCSPEGLAVDASGNIYVADEGNNRIRKVDTSGIITTVAGKGSKGYSGDGKAAVLSQFNGPSGVAVDASGNLYIADEYNNRVREVNTSGIITTVAGNGSLGYSGDGGAAKNAQLYGPLGVAVDAFGNLYIADSRNNCIRQVANAGRFVNAMIDGYSAYVSAYVDPNGQLAYTINASGLHKSSIDLDTGVSLYNFSYDPQNRLDTITDRFGNQTVIQRSNGTPMAIISPDGLTTQLSIDSSNHLTQITYPDGSHYNFEYTSGGLLTAKIDPDGNNFRNQFDASGRLVNISDDEGGLWQYSRATEATGDIVVRKQSAEGNVTTYLDHTDTTGAYTSHIIDPAGGLTTYKMSGDALSVQKKLSCGMSLSFKYDLDPEYHFKYVKQATETTPAGLTKTTSYGTTYQDTNADKIPDQITKTVTVNGRATTVLIDTLQDSRTATSPASRTVTGYYDPATLRTTSISVPGLYDTAFTYDGEGHLASIASNTRQSTFTYDSRGNLYSVTDPQNRTTTYTYDAVGRVTGVQRPDGSSLGFAYDPKGNLTLLTNPVDVNHGFTYNHVNLPSGYQTPISGSYSYVYDKDRNLIQINFPSGKQIDNIYTAGQLTRIQTPEGNIDLAYDCSSKIASITKGGESINYAYDGKLLTDETLSGTLNQGIDYTYDNDFNVTSMTYAGGTQNFGYDLDGLLTSAGAYTITRDAGNGLPVSVGGNGLAISRGFNGYGEQSSQDTSASGTSAVSWSLTRDNAGRIVAKTETVGGQTTNYAYTYDPMGRLLTVTRNGAVAEQYSYDLSGTRTSETDTLRGITNRSFSYSDEDQVLTAGNTTYQYDPDGFLTTKTVNGQTTTYSYSSLGELLQVSLPDGRTIGYVYDPLGRRIAKSINGVIVKKYLWQGMTKLLAVYDGSGNLIQRFEYADGRMPVVMTMAGVRYFLAYDQVGTLRAVTDGAGNIVKQIDYDSFGNVISDTDSSLTVPLGFAGGLYDPDTGLVRFGQRDYDPDTGRWAAKDPILFAGGDTDLYGYVQNNPVNFVDPLGLINVELALRSGSATIGNALGAIGGAVFAAGTGGAGAVIGGIVVFKSAYAVAANFQNLIAAFQDKGAVSRGAFLNDIADIAAPCNETAQQLATVADLSIDLMVLRASRLATVPDRYNEFGYRLLEGGGNFGGTFTGSADQYLEGLGAINAVDALVQNTPYK